MPDLRFVTQEYNPAEPIGNLREHPRNPRVGNVEKIGDSMDANGFYGAVLAQRSTGYIVRGNHTYRTAVAKGAETLPVLWADLDDSTALRIVLADNGTHEGGGYDNAILQAVLTDVFAEQGSLTGTGYSDEDWRRIMGEPFESFTGLPGLDGLPQTSEEQEAARRAAEPDGRAPEDGIVIPERWDVLVECADETQQTALLERLSGEGFTVRSLIS